MTVTLTVYRASWRAHIARTVTALPGLIPVVKGNGYGFGAHTLMPIVAELAGTVAVGSIYELASVPDELTPLVLTPASRPPDRRDAILTVGSLADVEALAGWPGRVVVKLRSSMTRFGCTPDELPAVRDRVHDSDLELVGYAIHLPLTGTDEQRQAEVEGWLDVMPAGSSVSVSHLGEPAYRALRTDRPDITWHIRAGSALWHGDKQWLRLSADAAEVRRVRAGDRVGYHATAVPLDGTMVIVGAGTAHGVAPLLDGRSPFHFARRRLAMVEPPHMHASLVLVPDGDPVPARGERVDLQRPLIATVVDEIEWL